jgi:hypothetical protein
VFQDLLIVAYGESLRSAFNRWTAIKVKMAGGRSLKDMLELATKREVIRRIKWHVGGKKVIVNCEVQLNSSPDIGRNLALAA